MREINSEKELYLDKSYPNKYIKEIDKAYESINEVMHVFLIPEKGEFDRDRDRDDALCKDQRDIYHSLCMLEDNLNGGKIILPALQEELLYSFKNCKYIDHLNSGGAIYNNTHSFLTGGDVFVIHFSDTEMQNGEYDSKKIEDLFVNIATELKKINDANEYRYIVVNIPILYHDWIKRCSCTLQLAKDVNGALERVEDDFINEISAKCKYINLEQIVFKIFVDDEKLQKKLKLFYEKLEFTDVKLTPSLAQIFMLSFLFFGFLLFLISGITTLVIGVSKNIPELKYISVASGIMAIILISIATFQLSTMCEVFSAMDKIDDISFVEEVKIETLNHCEQMSV